MNPRILLFFLLSMSAFAEENLVPNPKFSGTDSLQGWRTAFPYEGWYKENANYVKVAQDPAKGRVAWIELPPGIAGNQGGKIESAFIKAEPGATYRVDVDCKTMDFSAKLHVEAWTTDPKPISAPDKWRVPASGEMPALVMCYRAQIPDPAANSSTWETVGREFTLPKKVVVAGQEQKPEFLSVKAVVYAATQGGGKSCFTNFRLTRIK